MLALLVWTVKGNWSWRGGGAGIKSHFDASILLSTHKQRKRRHVYYQRDIWQAFILSRRTDARFLAWKAFISFQMRHSFCNMNSQDVSIICITILEKKHYPLRLKHRNALTSRFMQLKSYLQYPKLTHLRHKAVYFRNNVFTLTLRPSLQTTCMNRMYHLIFKYERILMVMLSLYSNV